VCDAVVWHGVRCYGNGVAIAAACGVTTISRNVKWDWVHQHKAAALMTVPLLSATWLCRRVILDGKYSAL